MKYQRRKKFNIYIVYNNYYYQTNSKMLDQLQHTVLYVIINFKLL